MAAASPVPEPEPEPAHSSPRTEVEVWQPIKGGTRDRGAQISADERREEVARLLKQRVTIRKMAAQFGVSSGTISSDIDIIRRRWQERASDTYDRHVAEEVAKLDEVERVWRPVMMAVTVDENGVVVGDAPMAAAAALILDRAAKHRSRLLGLDYRKPIEKPEDSEGRASLEQKRAAAFAMVDEFTERRLRAAEAEAEALDRAANPDGFDDDVDDDLGLGG